MSNSPQVQTGFAEVNGTTLYYEVAGVGHPFVLVHGHLLDRRSWDVQFADLMGVSGGGALAIDFTLEHPEMVDALIPVAAGVSGYRPSEAVLQTHPEVVRMYTGLEEAFEQHDVARAVEISLALWTDGPGRLPRQAALEVRERVREMTMRNWQRPDDEAQAQTPPVPLEPPAVGRLSQIGVPTLVILGEWDGPNPLEHLAAEIPGAQTVIMTGTAHHPFLEKPAEFNQIVLDFLGSLTS
jgi:pimeloyl-ACP methyl ester carboxylesterase